MADVPVGFVGQVRAEDLARLRAWLRRHDTLEDVLGWCRARSPPVEPAALVTQDEYTHDLVVALEPGLYAVYDAT